MLAGREDGLPGRLRDGRRLDPVVGTGGEIDHDPIHVGQDRLQGGQRTDGYWFPSRATNEPVQAGRPDQVVGEEGDARSQPSISARWWNTSRAVTTPVGRPSSMIGMWRNPPTAILWMAIAIGSS